MFMKLRVENKVTNYSLPDVEYAYYINKKVVGGRLLFEPGLFDNEQLGKMALNRYQRSSRHAHLSEKAQADGKDSPLETDISETEAPMRYTWRFDDVPKECSSCAGIAQVYPFFPTVTLKPQLEQLCLSSFVSRKEH